MRIETINGVLTASAESVSDIKTLLHLTATGNIMPKKKQAGAKKGKWVRTAYKMPCAKCGKRVHYMQMHDTVMHGEGRLLGAVHGDMAHESA